ncbi:putative N-acetyltransferase (TIGR04045 family) [Actinomycetospora succinea]|uniref:Putative N-acetyltransferase (TIGR04045 family) n=1 Tax=Actinomycetospora succinea TaxID=663603 RepID=A0A4R6VM59_9PSEU|nr:MSMEG_0567/Sll0786 family nitrogen starvation N-acetyltransferase [Actinomycetospora succinea]TDQ64872.1 putative N-acetyltransferase (TIGR04045 family) [Actinomycetospora succinea]
MTRSVARTVVCAVAADEAERAAHHRVRRAVFVDEQGIFAGDDLDSHDARDDVLHVVARVGEDVVGTVRLFPLDPADPAGTWQGDRLAVLAAARTAGAGAPLVRFAVATAAVRGGRRMVAHVQPANRRFFEHLGWTARETEDYAGRPHVFMTIALARDHQAPVLDEPGT